MFAKFNMASLRWPILLAVAGPVAAAVALTVAAILHYKLEFAVRYPLLFLVIGIAALTAGVVGYYNLRMFEAARKLWGPQIMLSAFSPMNQKQARSLWTQWVLFVVLLVLALLGPNISQDPEMVPAGAVQVEFVFDVSPSMGAEDYRGFLPAPPDGHIPGAAFQWGTRIDAAKYYARQLLLQIKDNEAGLLTVEGAGYDMWDITKDLSPFGAFNHMLDKFVQVGAAPGGGCDYTSGLQAALDEFKLISGLEKQLGDKADKIPFVVFFTDGGFTGDQAALNKVLDKYNEQKVNLLIVAMGGSSPMTVPKYDANTHRRSGEYYKGTTAVDLQTIKGIRDRVKGSAMIPAPPGTSEIKYSFPQKAGGIYAMPSEANLRPWFLLVALLLLVSITTGGGGMPRWKLIVPEMRPWIRNAAAFLKTRYNTFRKEKE